MQERVGSAQVRDAMEYEERYVGDGIGDVQKKSRRVICPQMSCATIFLEQGKLRHVVDRCLYRVVDNDRPAAKVGMAYH